MTNHGPAVKRFKPDFYSTKFAIIEYLYKHLLTNHEPLNVSSAYALLPPNLADQLKSEQGGLKSIILSYRHALRFDPIVKLITLANPLDNLITTKQKQSPKATFKTKPCFFDTFHPDGCPLTDDKCAFSHASRIKHDWGNIIHVRRVNNQSNFSTYDQSTPSQIKFLVIISKVFAFSVRVSLTYKYATKRMSPSFSFSSPVNERRTQQRQSKNEWNFDKSW